MEGEMAAKMRSLSNRLCFGPWTIISRKGPIMKSEDAERLSLQLDLPQLPEMLFADNCIEIRHEGGFGLNFNAIDALKLVENKQDLMKVAVAEEWQKTRAETDGVKEIVKPFDWTFTTDYKGSTINNERDCLRIVESKKRINMEKLKIKEKILFYEDIILYEDELADNGIATLAIKIRVMPSSFFALLRFFLRVDNVLVRMNDTRIYHEVGSNSIIREYTSKESSVSKLKNPFADPCDLADKLPLVKEIIEELQFQANTDSATNSEQEAS